MISKSHAIAAAAVAGFGVLAAAPPVPASASPPPSWTNERILMCDGVEVRTYLPPAGFGSPFHVVGSTDVIMPMYVVVTFQGETFTTIDVPGFDHDRADAVHCTYVDPIGLHVDFIGLRT